MRSTAVSGSEPTSTSIQRWIASAELERRIEVVIPFTTMRQVQTALHDAERLCAGLNAVTRVVRVVVVPFPLDLDHPAVPLPLIVHEMESLVCGLPLRVDVWLSRDLIPALVGALPEHPLVLLAGNRRPWRTREEKLARALNGAGCNVLLTYEANLNA